MGPCGSSLSRTLERTAGAADAGEPWCATPMWRRSPPPSAPDPLPFDDGDVAVDRQVGEALHAAAGRRLPPPEGGLIDSRPELHYHVVHAPQDRSIHLARLFRDESQPR